ncbi:MAG: Ig-like domain-containing protein [Candidatus Methanoperedens sp.]
MTLIEKLERYKLPVWMLIIASIISFIGGSILAPLILSPIFTKLLMSISYLYYLDDEPPTIESFFPNDGEYLTNVTNISIKVKDDGSGISLQGSEVNVVSSKNGQIKGKIKFEKNNIIFEPNNSFRPDAYTVTLKIVDKNNNNEQYQFVFYIIEEPEIRIGLYKAPPQVKRWWTGYFNQDYSLNEYYELIVENENSFYLENFVLEFQFPGVIVNYSVQEDDGIIDYNIKLGQYIISKGLERRNTTSCYSKININKIAPNGILTAVFHVDLQIQNYYNAMSCRPNIFKSNWNLVSNFEDKYKGSYNYQEFGRWFYQDFSNPIGIGISNLNLSDEQLKKQAFGLSQNLLEFALERDKNEPDIRSKDWGNYRAETVNLYFNEYSGKVAFLQEQFLKHGIEDKEFERLYYSLEDVYPFQKIALRLAALSSKLPPNLNNEQLKEQTLNLSMNLLEFSLDRDENAYSRDTKNLYFMQYGLNISILREEFLKREIVDDELDMLYGFPVGAYPYKEIALRLEAMSNKLPSNKSIVNSNSTTIAN